MDERLREEVEARAKCPGGRAEQACPSTAEEFDMHAEVVCLCRLAVHVE